jgi:hypothetical protein
MTPAPQVDVKGQPAPRPVAQAVAQLHGAAGDERAGVAVCASDGGAAAAACMDSAVAAAAGQ